MARHVLLIGTAVCTLSLGLGLAAFAQQGGRAAEGKKEAAKKAPERPPLFFSEGWKQQTKFTYQAPMTQEHVSNANLELKIYGGGPNGATILFTQHDAAEPPHGWNGMCNPTCALALHDRANYADLTGLARIGYQTFVNGFHQVRPIIKLADGTWLVGDKAIGTSSEYHFTEWLVQDIRWKKLDIAHVLEANDGRWVTPDLTRVDEIGWVDLTAGNGHGQGGWAGVGKIEVYGKPVARAGASSEAGR